MHTRPIIIIAYGFRNVNRYCQTFHKHFLPFGKISGEAGRNGEILYLIRQEIKAFEKIEGEIEVPPMAEKS